MQVKQPERGQLAALADYLAGQRTSILARWRQATEDDPELSIVSSLTRTQFNDHIPGLLDVLDTKLRSPPADDDVAKSGNEQAQVAGHGLERWQQGYQLRELTREWGHFQRALMQPLETYAREHPELDTSVMPTARALASRLCWDGVSESTTQYWKLHQAEAAGQVRDLQDALATLNELDQARASAWREAAHDLKGSVTVVTGATSILENPSYSDSMRSKFFDMLQRGVSSLHDMLNDLMSLARLEAGQEQRNLAHFDAAVLLDDFCTSSRPLAGAKGLYLKLEGPSSLMVQGDRPKLQRILQNLLLNALKYTAHGGVTVLWGSVEDDKTQNWMFCVQDTGPGLGTLAPLAQKLHEATQATQEAQDTQGEQATGDPAQDQTVAAPTLPAQSNRLPLHQQPGEGVGLSIVKRLCELLDATLELHTSNGEGSTFRVILPLQYDSAAQKP
jgi:signal transduction histidine kinase